jgi:hypothetical protein
MLFSVSFVLIWSLVSVIISLVGGWWRLAEHYRAAAPFGGQRWSWQTGWMGWSRYRGVLTVGADTTGLSLEVMPLFRLMHPPLFIPWGDIAAEERTVFIFPVVTLQLAQAPEVKVSLLRGTWDKVQAARGS